MDGYVHGVRFVHGVIRFGGRAYVSKSRRNRCLESLSQQGFRHTATLFIRSVGIPSAHYVALLNKRRSPTDALLRKRRCVQSATLLVTSVAAQTAIPGRCRLRRKVSRIAYRESTSIAQATNAKPTEPETSTHSPPVGHRCRGALGPHTQPPVRLLRDHGWGAITIGAVLRPLTVSIWR